MNDYDDEYEDRQDADWFAAAAEDEPQHAGESVVAWGVRTGRFSRDRAAWWQQQLDAEQRYIMASGGSGESAVEETIRGLYPALAGINAAAEPPLSRVEELERQIWGPSREQRWAEQDRRAEAQLAEYDQRIAASADDYQADLAYEALFGDE